MKRFLLPLIAALALPTAVNADEFEDNWKPIYNRTNIAEEYKYRKYFKY